MTENNIWQLTDMGNHSPRIWLVLENEHLLISWETLQEVRASPDFLNLQFMCEYGLVSFSSPDSLRELFEYFQAERLRRIDGRKLNCKIIKPE